MNEISSVTFGAKYLNSVRIQKYNKQLKKFVPYDVNFVRIDGANRNDLDVLDNIAKTWSNAKYLQTIVTAAHWMDKKPDAQIKVYAITTQRGNFDKLRPHNILGLAEMTKDDDFENSYLLHRLQVKPEEPDRRHTKMKKYKRVGSSMLKALKNEYDSITLYAEEGTEAFYKSNGFIEDFCGQRHFVWSLNIFKRAKIHIRSFLLKNGFVM